MRSVVQSLVLMIILTGLNFRGLAQSMVDSTAINKEFNSLEEALKNPELVYRLNLSNQKLNVLSDSIWDKFKNLEYLSLKDDHLEEIPAGIGNLRNLKVLDLSGNNFTTLPSSLSKLNNLSEVYLNNEVKMDFEQSLSVLKKLPNLQILHLENDNLTTLPEGLLKLKNLESLYLNNNRFSEFPTELRRLDKLTYIDFHDNQLKLTNQMQNQGFGFKIDF